MLNRASSTMGAEALKSIHYVNEGTDYTFGQAYKPGMPWPKITIHSQVRTINYESGSMREEIALSRAEPKGGGGYPAVGQKKNDQFFSGTYAWNQTGAGPVAGPRFVNDRMHQLWITPHGVLKVALRNSATLVRPGKGEKPSTAVTFAEPGRFTATVFINHDNRVERVGRGCLTRCSATLKQ